MKNKFFSSLPATLGHAHLSRNGMSGNPHCAVLVDVAGGHLGRRRRAGMRFADPQSRAGGGMMGSPRGMKMEGSAVSTGSRPRACRGASSLPWRAMGATTPMRNRGSTKGQVSFPIVCRCCDFPRQFRTGEKTPCEASIALLFLDTWTKEHILLVSRRRRFPVACGPHSMLGSRLRGRICAPSNRILHLIHSPTPHYTLFPKVGLWEMQVFGATPFRGGRRECPRN
jgi:hypothetical protein